MTNSEWIRCHKQSKFDRGNIELNVYVVIEVMEDPFCQCDLGVD